MSKTIQFKTESKKLLDLMINSIYANQEIFLRELISNASDAIDKYHYLSLTDASLTKGEKYLINISIDKENKKLIIEDNGIGMTEEEVINNLGTIAKSGSLEFLKKMENVDASKETDIIGQFGVGFYSAFMVAKEVIVETKSPYSSTGYRFKSNGTESFELEETNLLNHGSKIILLLRDDTEEENFSKYLDQYTIKRLVKKYSDYIRYPIQMMVTNYRQVENEETKENETVSEDVLETLNSMIPLWKKNKKDVTEEDLNNFYKQKFNDYQDPILSLHLFVEGNITYNALLFIPSIAPFDLYSDKYEKGLELYTKGVFIMEKCKELVPDHFRYLKGLVDSSDLSLNISREILQQNKQLEKIATNIEKKVVTKLQQIMKDDYDKYLKFFNLYGRHIKFGVYQNYGTKKDLLQDLLIYNTMNEENLISLATYVEKMKEDQKYIYYASGKNKDAILAMPQMDLLKQKGYDVLILSDDVDEFAIRIIDKYLEKEFKSINQGDLDLVDEEKKKEVETKQIDKKIILDAIKDCLNDQVKEVRLSTRLTDSPVCLVSGDGLSFEMEKVLAAMPDSNNQKAERILEINPNHPILDKLEDVYTKDASQFNTMVQLLYQQSLLMEGLSIDNPSDFSNKMIEIMLK